MAYQRNGHEDNRIHYDTPEVAPQQNHPGAPGGAFLAGVAGVAVYEYAQAPRQVSLKGCIGRIGHADEIWRCESGDYRYGHYYRVYFMIQDAQTHAERGDDEGELAYLGERES